MNIKSILIIITLIIISIPMLNVYAAQTPNQALIDYYDACKQGSIKAYLNTVDLEYINENIANLEEYKNFVEAALIEYPMTSYKINNLKIKEIKGKNLAIAFFDIEANIVPKATGKAIKIDREMAALLTQKRGDWKVAFVIDRKLFWAQQEAAMTLITLNETLPIFEELRQRIESIQVVPEVTPTTSPTKPTTTPIEVPISIPGIGWLNLTTIIPIILIMIIITAIVRMRKRK
ncbi:MAG: hypothetical protein QW372_02885 [Nitrososphaerales archaeon]